MKIKKILAVSLTIILLLPFAVQLLDGYFHKHHISHKHECSCRQHSDELGIPRFEAFQKKCPIPGFEYSTFYKYLANGKSSIAQKYADLVSSREIIKCCSSLVLSINLRAPPF